VRSGECEEGLEKRFGLNEKRIVLIERSLVEIE
jgi:hypothetical protein